MLLIFDCDGVVIDSLSLHTEIESETYARLGIEISPAELGRRFSGVSQVEMSKILARENGCTIPPEFDAEVNEYKARVLAERVKTIPNIQTALFELRDVPRCIASGSSMATVTGALKGVNLYEEFAPNIFSSELVAQGKPAPDLFLFAASRMQVSPADCIVIEDAVVGVQAAKAAGMQVFGFTGGSHCDDELSESLKKAGASNVFNDMCTLPRLIQAFAGKPSASANSQD